jgi:hypothetical protein
MSNPNAPSVPSPEKQVSLRENMSRAWPTTSKEIFDWIDAEKARADTAVAALEGALQWGDVEDEWSDAILAELPTRSGSHESYALAMRMVGSRQSKGELVALVNWLLVMNGRALNGRASDIIDTARDSQQWEQAARETQSLLRLSVEHGKVAQSLIEAGVLREKGLHDVAGRLQKMVERLMVREAGTVDVALRKQRDAIAAWLRGTDLQDEFALDGDDRELFDEIATAFEAKDFHQPSGEVTEHASKVAVDPSEGKLGDAPVVTGGVSASPARACRRCSECRGEAHHFNEVIRNDAGDMVCKHCEVIAEECEECDGSGSTDEPEMQCDACKGSGLIVTDRYDDETAE